MNKHLIVAMSFWISVGVYIGADWSAIYTMPNGGFDHTLLAINFVAMIGVFYVLDWVAECVCDLFKLIKCKVGGWL